MGSAIFYSRLIYGIILYWYRLYVHVHLAYKVYIQCASYINVLSIVVPPYSCIRQVYKLQTSLL